MSKGLTFILAVFGAAIVAAACSPYPLGKMPPSVVNRNEDRWLRSINNEMPEKTRQIAILCGWNKMGYRDLPQVQKCMLERELEPPERVKVSIEECGGRGVEIAIRQQCMLNKGYIYMDDPVRPFCDLKIYSSAELNKYPVCRASRHP